MPQIKDYLRGIDITVLEGDCSHIKVNGIEVDLCGIDDPTRLADSTWKAQLDKAYSETNPDSVKILVSHRPERVSVYEQYDFDLIVAGHAHAGQVVIPFINRGLYVPNQGIFAIKMINADNIQKNPLLLDQIEHSEEIANIALQNGVNAISALKINNQFIQDIAGMKFLVYKWSNGKILLTKELTLTVITLYFLLFLKYSISLNKRTSLIITFAIP